jgi:hypothetical protein
MRCYFLQDNHIVAVYPLRPGPDHALIRQGEELYEQHGRGRADAFEIWVKARFVYNSMAKAEPLRRRA